jgi:predicted PurR-regulated permease PerM
MVNTDFGKKNILRKKVDFVKELVMKIITMLSVILAFIFTILIFVYFIISVNSMNNNSYFDTLQKKIKKIKDDVENRFDDVENLLDNIGNLFSDTTPTPTPIP